MAIDKSLLSGSTTLLILKLLEDEDMYGYQIIEELARRSDRTFQLKTGTLYPLLHALEDQGLVSAYENDADSPRPRRYYHLTSKGAKQLRVKQAEWREYSFAVRRVLEGGVSCVHA